MTTPRVVAATAVAVALAAATAALSRVPLTPDNDARAALRISWRARGERVERCRRLSDRELEAIPVHMRQPTVCEGGSATYRLRVLVDDTVRIDALVRGSGARGDRPMYVFHELPLAPGEHVIHVALALTDSSVAAPGRDRGRADDQEKLADPTEHRPPAASGTAREHGRDALEDQDERAVRDAARDLEHAGADETVPRTLDLEERIHLPPRGLVLVTYLPERRRLALLTR
jgi:hypothetical protein